MAIPPEEVRRVAALARLEIPEDRLDRVARELSAVLEYAAVLRNLDLAGCEPSSFAPGGVPLRADEPAAGLAREDALAMAPEAEEGFFLVPPFVEDLEP